MDTTVSDNAQVVCTIDDPAAHGEQVKATARELLAAGFRPMLVGAPQTLDSEADRRMTKVGAPQLPGEEVRWTANKGTDDIAHIDRGVELRGGIVNLAVVPSATTMAVDIDGDQEWAAFSTATGLDEAAVYETTPGSHAHGERAAHDQGRHVLITIDEGDTELLEAKAELGKSHTWDIDGTSVLFRLNGGYAVTYPSVRADGRFNGGRYERTGAIIECPHALREHIIAEAEKKRQAEAKRDAGCNVQGAVEVATVDPEALPSGFGRVGEAAREHETLRCTAFLAAWEQERTIESVLTDPRVPEEWRFEYAGTDGAGVEQWTAPGPHTSPRSAVVGRSTTTGNELLNIFSPSAPDDLKAAFHDATEGNQPYGAGASYGAWQLTVALVYRGDWRAAKVGEGLALPEFAEQGFGVPLRADMTADRTSAEYDQYRRAYLAARGFEWAEDYPAPCRYIDAVTVDGQTTVYVETSGEGSTGHEEVTGADTAAATTEEATLYAVQLSQSSGFLTLDPEAGTLTAAPAVTELPTAEPPVTVTPATSTPPQVAAVQPQAVPEQPQLQPQATGEQLQESTHDRLMRKMNEVLDKWVPEIEAGLGRALTAEQRDALGRTLYPTAFRHDPRFTELLDVIGAPMGTENNWYKSGSPVAPEVVAQLFNDSELTRAIYWNHVDNNLPGSPLGGIIATLLGTVRRIDPRVSSSPIGNGQPLSLFTAAVGRAGIGKTSSLGIPKGIRFTDPGHAGPVSDDEVLDYDRAEQPISSRAMGELLVTLTPDPETKKQVWRPASHPTMRIVADELSIYLRELSGSDVSGLGTLTAAFSGTNFVAGSCRNGHLKTPEHYTVTLEAGIQQDTAHLLLESAGLGLLQRFVLFPAAWPWSQVLDERDIARPQRPLAEQPPITLPIVGESFKWCPEMFQEYYMSQELRAADRVPAWLAARAHELPLQYRVACMYAAVQGRADLTAADWEWARLLVSRVSSRTLDGLQAAAKAQQRQSSTAKGGQRAYERLGAEEALAAEQEELLQDVLTRLGEEYGNGGGSPVTESAVCRRFSGGKRRRVKDALTTLLEMGKVDMVITTGSRVGKAYTPLDTAV